MLKGSRELCTLQVLVGCKLVTASSQKRMVVRLKFKIDLPYDLVAPLLGLSPENTRVKKTQAGNPALQQYLPQPRFGSNRNVHQQMNAQRKSGPCTQWNISIEKNETVPFAPPQQDLEIITQLEVTKKQKDTYPMLSFIGVT